MWRRQQQRFWFCLLILVSQSWATMESVVMIIKAQNQNDSSEHGDQFAVDISFDPEQQDGAIPSFPEISSLEFFPPVESGQPAVIYDSQLTKETSFHGQKRGDFGDANIIKSTMSDGSVFFTGSMTSGKFVYQLSTMEDGVYVRTNDNSRFGPE